MVRNIHVLETVLYSFTDIHIHSYLHTCAYDTPSTLNSKVLKRDFYLTAAEAATQGLIYKVLLPNQVAHAILQFIHPYIHTCKNMLIWLIVYDYAYLDEHIQFMIYIFTHIHRYYFCRGFLLVVSAVSVANQGGGLRVIQGGAMGQVRLL
jgi:hypothetical protein